VKGLLMRFAGLVGLALLMAGCAMRGEKSPARAVLRVPALDCQVTLDGVLDEPCYRRAALVTDFVIAGEAHRRAAATAAWLFWTDDRLVFAFDCDDPTPVASPPSGDERDVDRQDRVELFLWSGRETDGYFCLEIAAGGAVHDYQAKFYRRFDDSWSPGGWEYTVKVRPGGYIVEAALPRAALEEMGFHLRARERWRAGLFRADFAPGKPDAPDWITWIEARTPQPDFHVAGAFGTLVFDPKPESPPD